MSTPAFTLFHVVVSLIAIVTGIIVAVTMLGSKTAMVGRQSFSQRRHRRCGGSTLITVEQKTLMLSGPSCEKTAVHHWQSWNQHRDRHDDAGHDGSG